MEDQKSLVYSLTQKNKMLVVSLTGELSNNALSTLESCRKEILSKEDATFVVLYFQEVENISSDVISLLAQMQRDIRQKPAELRLCLKESLREKLVRMGVVRGLEVAEDLRSALLSFSSQT